MRHGSCLCGGIAFEIAGSLAPPSACHCSQCRKQSGHIWSSTHIPQANLTMTAQDSLRWYAASDIAKRGFCATCGSFLFWKHKGEDKVSVAMGSLDAPTNVQLARHIFIASKGDYYQIADGLPQLETS